MANIRVAIINASTVLTDNEVTLAVSVLQTQVHRDFAAAWGIDADLTFVPSTAQQLPADHWWLVILDNSDQAGALGYHDLTTTGLPLGKVFAGTDKQFGYQWTVTASHELLEMLGDPDVNLTVFVQSDAGSGTLYAYETCDACEADNLGYEIDGILVSDFVYPSWFESFWQPNGTQFDYGNHIHSPFELVPGGYIGAFDVKCGTGWHQVTPPGQTFTYDMRPRLGSRREKRRTLRNHWVRSSAFEPARLMVSPGS
jgi:hypothetical protein